ncbi:hypothetical protein EKO27_g8497 [Xylaria grammica]|uniref:Uncharacterized protein n=1 Tax=Xylaria grammica TaxID=363999 RepID=A0A439CX38_9PEZI|nr:hypothetical protein EKO27_g8497 [Xylaria grammica]
MSTEPAPRSAVAKAMGVSTLPHRWGGTAGGFLRLVVGAAASAQVGWTRGLRCDRLPCRLQRESDRDGGPKTSLGPREIRPLDLSAPNARIAIGTTGRRGMSPP